MRTSKIPQSEPSGNGQPIRPGQGLQAEGEDAAGLRFDLDSLEAPEATTTDNGPDPFDPASLRLTADAATQVGVKKALLTVPCRKPDKAWFVRAHPDPAYRLQTLVLELREDRETYLIAPALWSELATEATVSARALFVSINRQSTLFLWPVRLPGPDGKLDTWSRSALAAANLAAKSWVRVAPNMSLGGYDVFQASAQLSEPEWPTMPLREILRVAFKDHLIDSLEHPVLKRLRGEV